MKEDLAGHVLPIAFCFLFDDCCFLVPLAGDADVAGAASADGVASEPMGSAQQAQQAQQALEFIRVFLQCEGLVRVTCHLQRLLRLLDLYAQRHLHARFVTPSLCASTLGDLALLQWLLDPDATDNIRALLANHKPVSKPANPDTNTPNTPTNTPTDTPTDTPTETKPDSLDALFRLLGLTCPPVASVWTEKDPEAAWIAHLQALLAAHVPVLPALTRSNGWRHWRGRRSWRPTPTSRCGWRRCWRAWTRRGWR